MPQHWCGPLRGFPPVTIRFPSLPLGEGGSRVSRKRETDEGLASPFGRGAGGGEGAFCPLSHFVTAPPEWEPRGTRGRIATPVLRHWLAMTTYFSDFFDKTTNSNLKHFLQFRRCGRGILKGAAFRQRPLSPLTYQFSCRDKKIAPGGIRAGTFCESWKARIDF